jgi:hypothetical protein
MSSADWSQRYECWQVSGALVPGAVHKTPTRELDLDTEAGGFRAPHARGRDKKLPVTGTFLKIEAP